MGVEGGRGEKQAKKWSEKRFKEKKERKSNSEVVQKWSEQVCTTSKERLVGLNSDNCL